MTETPAGPQSELEYGLVWPGKAAARSRAYAPGRHRLIGAGTQPPTISHAGNMFVEGDNLDALKALRPSHLGCVKMIYIDPPYNTGKARFIYADDFAESRANYAQRAGQVLAKAEYTIEERRLNANRAKSGRIHSKWLSEIYPRILLARNFLRDDGVIYVSIDDREVHNQRHLLDEVFGEENFEGHIHWRRRHNQPNDKTKMIGLVAEHILCYARDSEALRRAGVGKLPLTGKFGNPDADPRGEWASKPWKVGAEQSGSRYTIETPSGKTYDELWMGDEGTYRELLADGRMLFTRGGAGLPRKKYYRSEREVEGQCANNWWGHEGFGSNQDGSVELARLFDGAKGVFSNPKPTRLLKSLIRLANVADGDVVMDFYAGSGSTGDAVMQLHAEGIGARFVLVQLPELLSGRPEYLASAQAIVGAPGGEVTIADLCRERLRRAAEKYGQSFETYTLEALPAQVTNAPASAKTGDLFESATFREEG